MTNKVYKTKTPEVYEKAIVVYVYDKDLTL